MQAIRDRNDEIKTHTYIHGICKEDHDRGVAVGSRCGGTIKYYSNFWGHGFECDRCGEWYQDMTKHAYEIIESGQYFNIEGKIN